MVWPKKKKKKNKLIKAPEEGYAPPKFFPAKNCACVITETTADLIPCNVFLNQTIRYQLPDHLRIDKVGKFNKDEAKDRMAFISKPPHIFTIPLGKVMPTAMGRLFSPKYQRFHVYFVDPLKDITVDPSREKLPDDVVKGLRVLLQSKAALEEFDVIGRIAKGQQDDKKMSDYIWPILFVIQTFIFLIFYVLMPMWAGG